jgi:hypothetical protein
MAGLKFYDFLEGPWEQAKGYLREHLEQLDITLTSTLTNISSGTPLDGTVGGDITTANQVVTNTGSGPSMRWAKVALSTMVTGRLPIANFVAASANVLLGRRSASSGNFEEITPGSGLNLNSTSLETTYSKPFMMMAQSFRTF